MALENFNFNTGPEDNKHDAPTEAAKATERARSPKATDEAKTAPEAKAKAKAVAKAAADAKAKPEKAAAEKAAADAKVVILENVTHCMSSCVFLLPLEICVDHSKRPCDLKRRTCLEMASETMKTQRWKRTCFVSPTKQASVHPVKNTARLGG